jgi:hypothetical protein
MSNQKRDAHNPLNDENKTHMTKPAGYAECPYDVRLLSSANAVIKGANQRPRLWKVNHFSIIFLKLPTSHYLTQLTGIYQVENYSKI